MFWERPTYRMVDGERIDGAWCHVWRRHRVDSRYFVADLTVYADGAIGCGGRTDLDGLGRLLAKDLLAPTDPQAPPFPREPSKWASRNGEPLTPEGFLQEVADRVEQLNGRPTAAQRCWDAIRSFQRDPGEAGRERLRAAYLAVPPHLRIYVLGDMDRQDRPLRILFTEVGERADGDGPVVTAEMHQEVLEYFDRGDRGVESEREQRAVQHSDDPSGPGRPALVSLETVHPRGWPEEPGPFMLRNEFPARIEFAGASYASVVHAYWALAAAEDADRERIREAATGREARDLGGAVRHRSDWADVRLAVMAGLLRAKYTQHPGLAWVLLSTGDARISYTGLWDAPFWRDVPDGRGRNWVGRLLELTRSELLAEQLFPAEEIGAAVP
ncbi:NADAR family protein [Streptomyces aureus]